MARVTFLLPEKKSGLPKDGKCIDLATAQRAYGPVLPRLPQGRRLASTDYLFKSSQQSAVSNSLSALSALNLLSPKLT